jgi:hypothetical protein
MLSHLKENNVDDDVSVGTRCKVLGAACRSIKVEGLADEEDNISPP